VLELAVGRAAFGPPAATIQAGSVEVSLLVAITDAKSSKALPSVSWKSATWCSSLPTFFIVTLVMPAATSSGAE
jgi:hypothetical protein